MKQIILIAHNVRSAHNIGAMMRTAEGMGIYEFIISGYSPYPRLSNDPRLPHIADKMTRAIHKTALGAEINLSWQYAPDILPSLKQLQRMGFALYALEQSSQSTPLPRFKSPNKVALIVGNEITGIEPKILVHLDGVVEIPMHGRKESYNVATAAAIALYHCKFFSSKNIAT